jgi:opacity protein-like surface antigen
MRLPLLLALVGTAPAALGQYQPYSSPRRMTPQMENVIGSDKFDVTAYAGWQLNGDTGTTGGNLNTDDSTVYGAAIDYRASPLGAVELMWLYTKPKSQFFSVAYPSTQPFEITSNYFQIGGTHTRRTERLELILGFTLGAAVFSPDNVTTQSGTRINTSDTWRFATTLFLGTKIWLTQNIGVRLEGRLLTPILFQSAGFYAGTGGGGMAVAAGIPSVQFAFIGGICFGK